MDFVYTEEIRGICVTAVACWAHTWATRVGKNRGIDRNLRGQVGGLRYAGFMIAD